MDRFENKVVLITGAGDVAGAAAKRMMAEGARIAFADFSQQALDQAAADLQAAGFSAERILCVQCDVRSMDSCRNAAEAVLEKWGQIDTLLATAGITRHMDIEEMTEKDWQDVVDINLTGVYHACKAVVPAMRKRHYGHIVVISSIGGCKLRRHQSRCKRPCDQFRLCARAGRYYCKQRSARAAQGQNVCLDGP